MSDRIVPNTIVTLCGSTRFREAFEQANAKETLCGRIVLGVGVFNGRSLAQADDSATANDPFAHYTDADKEQIKRKLDLLHLRKIMLSDEILVLNVGGYYGESTTREIAFAFVENKRIRWLVEPEDDIELCAQAVARFASDPLFVDARGFRR